MKELGRLAKRTRDRAEARVRLTDRELGMPRVPSARPHGRSRWPRDSGLSPRTMDSHIQKLYRKLGVRNRVQAISRATTLRLIELG